MWVFFHEHTRITGLQEKGAGIPLSPHYHFHLLHRHLDISRAITAENSPLHIALLAPAAHNSASSPLHIARLLWTQTGNLWLPSESR